MQACKPDSVPRLSRGSYHLSGHAIAGVIKQPTPPIPRFPIAIGTELNEPLNRGYLAFQLVRFTMPPQSPLGR